MAEQTLGDRDERLAANFDGTEFTECFPTSQGVSFRSKLGTAASRDVEDFVETADAPSDSAWTITTTLLNEWTGEVKYIRRLGSITITGQVDNSSANSFGFFSLPAEYSPATSVRFSSNNLIATVTSSGDMSMSLSETVSDIRFCITYPVF